MIDVRAILSATAIGLTVFGLLPEKQTIRVASNAVEGTSPALPVTTVTPNTTAGEPVAVPDDPVPTSQAAVVSLTSPLEAELESLRAERDELLATVASLEAQVKRLSELTSVKAQPLYTQPQPVKPQPVRYYSPQQYGSCSNGSCGPSRGGFRPFQRLRGW